MATLFEPVGPLSRGVYWRRRALVLAVVLVLLFLLLRACGGGDGSDGDTSATGSTSSPSATASSTPKASSSASPKASSSPSASASKSATTSVPACKDSDVSVTTRTSKTSYAVGDTVSITYVVATKDGVTCKRDVGGTANEVRVAQNGRIIWSSDYCSPGGDKDVRTLGPNASFSVIVDWDGDVTPASCPDDRLPAPAGEYQVLGRNGTLTGPASELTLG